MALLSSHCGEPFDLCAPQSADLAFFSKGDCVFTRASFFQGREWLSWFSNQELALEDRFNSVDLQRIAEGNRRVDWPIELLVHMNGGILQYIEAVSEFTERPEHQRFHFLLTDKNTTPDAVAEAHEELRRLTLIAISKWQSNRVKALVQVGRAHHLIQDSFSDAHARRDQFDPTGNWCVIKVKAYIEREEGYDTPDIEYHGENEGYDDALGHTTTEDSIYRKGKDCTEPSSEQEVRRCLSQPAKRAISAGADYLRMIRQAVRRLNSDEAPEPERIVDELLGAYLERHMALCER